MRHATISELEYKGFPAVLLRSAMLEIIVIPSLGAKAVSLRFLPTGRQWLWQDPTRPYRSGVYGDDFAAYDISGFDECFPSIGECFYPDYPWKGAIVPDHGELWSLPWEYKIEENSLHLQVHGVRFPYLFEKWLTFTAPGRCRIQYRVTNLSSFPFKYIWSAHPMFAIEPGMRIHLPGTPRLYKEFGIGGRIGPDRGPGNGGYLSEHVWPFVVNASGEQEDLRDLDYPIPPVMDKVYADGLSSGWCALHNPRTGEYVSFAFSPSRVPRVGVCVDMGAWPFTGQPSYWTALEPCTGCTDRLDVAILRGEHSVMETLATKEWTLNLVAGQMRDINGLTPEGDLT